MGADIRCPKCHSENVIFSKKRKMHVCEDCGHEVSEEKSIKPLRIFLSYGHDSNEEIVRRIKEDLEKRGHDVWFDKAEIKFGDDWRREITDGIVGSNRVLSFLSKYSTRDPGVCRDEIAIAIGVKGGNIQTILVESETEVLPPVNIGHIQWLDMHDWKERQAVGEAAWDLWYKNKLTEIVRVIESEESIRFAGEIEKLDEYLKPIKSDARIYDLLKKGYIGREWLFEAVENWRNPKTPSPQEGERAGVRGASRLFWITGDPGVGKSAFAARLTHTRSDTVIAAQFVEWDKPDHRDARRVVRSIAFQLATRLPDYRKLLLTLPEISELDRKDPAELFDYLLVNPLKTAIHGGRNRYLIIIDALDEAGESGRNALVDMLARNAARLPDWLGIVVTSRPESAVTGPFQGLNPTVLDTKTEDNKEDIRTYLRHHLEKQLKNRQDTDLLIDKILEKSEGVFLYIERFCEDVRKGHVSLDRSEDFPQGLGGIFYQWFQRQFPDIEKFRKEIRPALRAILAAREPLPVEILQRLFNWQDEELRDFTRTLGSLFPVTKDATGDVIKPYHKSLADWLTDEAKATKYFVSVIEGHRLIAFSGWREYSEGIEGMSEYNVRHSMYHLRMCGQTEKAETMSCSATFLKKRKSLGVGVNLPRLSLGSRFYDREDLLQKIVHHFHRPETTSKTAMIRETRPLVITGLGGLGKTQVAVEYAFKNFDYYSHLLFIRSDCAGRLNEGLSMLADRNVLDLDSIDEVVKWLKNHNGWLLIIDDVDCLTPETEFFIKYFCSTGHILITSRLAEWQSLADCLAITELSQKAAVEFLLHATGRILDEEEQKACEKLAKLLEGIPLALEQAAAFVQQTGCLFSDCLRKFNEVRTQ